MKRARASILAPETGDRIPRWSFHRARREEHAEIASDDPDGCACSICWWTDALIWCDKCWAEMVDKKKREEEFEKERDELLMRIEMSRAKEPWLAQCWKREIHKCVKKEKRSSKGLSEEELIAMID